MRGGIFLLAENNNRPNYIIMFTSTPRHHARVEHRDPAGIPVVTILINDGDPWDRWSEYRTRFQIGRQKSVARHVGMFIDFLGARSRDFIPLESRGKLLQAFADALAMGTIALDGTDSTGLRWLPLSSREARLTLADVTAFGDWLEEKGYAPAINPVRKATLAEQIVFWKRWSHRKGVSLLDHLKTRARDVERSMIAREAILRKQKVHQETEAKAFPENAIVPLLRDGFSARPPHLRWTMLRDQLIVLLLHFGGKRVSETLHMWVGDVERHPQDPTRCIPWIAHPSEGPADWVDPLTNVSRRVKREEYLKLKYGIRPLTLETGRDHVGWKNPLLNDENRMRVFWNDVSADRLFWTTYRDYIRQRPLIHRHPYLFITKGGDPMTVPAFEKVHGAAVRRIGLIPAKNLGTTPHGHRHAYGHVAESRQVGTKAFQVAMGHKSIEAQEAYKNDSHEAVADLMTAAEERLSGLRIERITSL